MLHVTKPSSRRHDLSVPRVLESLGALPPPATRRPVLVMTVGLPGTGKSTVARRVAAAIDGVILESDRVRKLLRQTPRYTPRESFVVFRTIDGAAHRLLGQGISVIIDATSLSEADRRPLYLLAEDLDVPLVIVLTTAPAEVVIPRLETRQDVLARAPHDASDAGPAVYERMLARYEPPSRPHHVVDTSDPASTEAALAAIIEEARRHTGTAPTTEET